VQVAGRLLVELSRLSGSLVDRCQSDYDSSLSADSSNDMLRSTNVVTDLDDESSPMLSNNFVCKV